MIAFEGAMLVIGAILIGGKHLGMPDHHHGVMLGAAAASCSASRTSPSRP
jgi:hypothetical protein